MFPPIIPARTLTADVANQIERMIREGILTAGQRLPSEHELIKSMNVSRTVLREAVAALRAQGLLTSRRGAGVFVAVLPPQPPFRIKAGDIAALPKVLELLEFRAGIEVECAGLAAQRRTPEQAQAISSARIAMWDSMKAGNSGVEYDVAFHSYIAQATHNAYFLDFLNYLHNIAMIPRSQLHGQYAKTENLEYAKLIYQMHLAIEKAIMARDPIAAREAMRRHFLLAAEHYRNVVAED